MVHAGAEMQRQVGRWNEDEVREALTLHLLRCRPLRHRQRGRRARRQCHRPTWWMGVLDCLERDSGGCAGTTGGNGGVSGKGAIRGEDEGRGTWERRGRGNVGSKRQTLGPCRVASAGPVSAQRRRQGIMPDVPHSRHSLSASRPALLFCLLLFNSHVECRPSFLRPGHWPAECLAASSIPFWTFLPHVPSRHHARARDFTLHHHNSPQRPKLYVNYPSYCWPFRNAFPSLHKFPLVTICFPRPFHNNPILIVLHR